MADPVETSVSVSPTTSIFMGEPGVAKPKATSSTGEGSSAEFTAEGDVTTRTGLGEEASQDTDEELLEDSPEAGEDGGEADDPEAGAELEDLGDYDPTSEESITKFDERYVKEDGTLDIRGSLSAEFWSNAGKGVDGLNEATYAYLRDRFGIDKETIKDLEAGQKAALAQTQEQFFARVGGKDRFDAAMKWGREGGYTKAQRDRFNAVVASNDKGAVDDAVDALMARYEKAAGTKVPPPRRPVKPARDVTSAATRKSVEPYATREDWAKEFKAADKDDAALMASIRRRLKSSAWYKQG